MTTDNRKKIILSETPDLHDQSRLTLEAIASFGREVYKMDRSLVRVVTNENENKKKIELLTRDSLRHEASHAVRYAARKSKGDGTSCYSIKKYPPLDIIKDALASAEIPLPVINGILSHPTISENGKMIHKPGYNSDIKFYIDADAEILKAAENVPVTPTAEEVAEAVKAIDEVIINFPFKSAADRAGYFAMLLTLMFLPLINGSIPLFLIRAPTPGTGKTLLGETGIKIVTGRPAATTPEMENEEELKKTLHSLLLSGAEYIFIDNVTTKIKSGTLAAMITSRRFNCRILGSSTMASVPCNAPLIFTANNPDLSRENARRCVPIEVACDFENPAERTGFKHPDLNQYITDNRPALIRACLIMARAWFADECGASGVKILPSFENWSRTIGGILKSCGVKGFLENTKDFFSTADGDAENITAFVHAWNEEKGEYPVFANEILHLAGKYGLVDERKPEGSQSRSLGKLLNRKQDMVFSGIKITRGSLSNGITTWKTTKI
jgi:hypothetical protein